MSEGYRLYRGKCKEFCERACLKDPTLTLVRGHYFVQFGILMNRTGGQLDKVALFTTQQQSSFHQKGWVFIHLLMVRFIVQSVVKKF